VPCPESAAALSRGEWPAYAGTYAAARYSPLTQIDRENAKELHVAWRWKSPDHAIKDGNPRVWPDARERIHAGDGRRHAL
jgi:quinoprotein glucose dehydrogenase